MSNNLKHLNMPKTIVREEGDEYIPMEDIDLNDEFIAYKSGNEVYRLVEEPHGDYGFIGLAEPGGIEYDFSSIEDAIEDARDNGETPQVYDRDEFLELMEECYG